MKKNNISIGRYGEEVARKYLQRRRYKVIEQNYQTRHGEIDLIARDRKVLVFVEVRAKSGVKFGTPEESLTWKKVNKVIANAAAYVVRSGYSGLCRIDAICIVFDSDNELVRLSHYKNIVIWADGSWKKADIDVVV